AFSDRSTATNREPAARDSVVICPNSGWGLFHYLVASTPTVVSVRMSAGELGPTESDGYGGRWEMKPRRSGRPPVEAFRTAQPPVRVPTAGTAWAVWKLIQPRLKPVPVAGREHPRRIEDVASSVLTVKRASASERTQITVTALQALAVAIDVMVCAGRDDK